MRQLVAVVAVLFMFLGARSMQPVFAEAQNTSRIVACTLQITGMTWAGCAAAVTNAAKKIDGVKDVTVSLEKKTAEITYDADKTTAETIAKTIANKTGFKVTVAKKDGT